MVALMACEPRGIWLLLPDDVNDPHPGCGTGDIPGDPVAVQKAPASPRLRSRALAVTTCRASVYLLSLCYHGPGTVLAPKP